MTDVDPETEEEETMPKTRPPIPGEYVDPQPVAVDMDGDEAVGVAPETVEALVATVRKELLRLSMIDPGFERADSALARLSSLLLRAEQDRDEWKRKAEIDEQQASDRLKDWQAAHDALLRAEEERDKYAEALRRIAFPELRGPNPDAGIVIARRALAPEETKEKL